MKGLVCTLRAWGTGRRCNGDVKREEEEEGMGEVAMEAAAAVECRTGVVAIAIAAALGRAGEVNTIGEVAMDA